MSMRFETTCVSSTGELINAMTDGARQITRRTFLRYVDRASLAQIERELGYDTGTERGGLRMANDWHVAYYRSTYNGRPCVYFDHSRIEHIFTDPEAEVFTHCTGCEIRCWSIPGLRCACGGRRTTAEGARA